MQFGPREQITVIGAYYPPVRHQVTGYLIITGYPFDILVHKSPDSLSGRWRASERSTGIRVGDSFHTRREAATNALDKVKKAGIKETEKCLKMFNSIDYEGGETDGS